MYVIDKSFSHYIYLGTDWIDIVIEILRAKLTVAKAFYLS